MLITFTRSLEIDTLLYRVIKSKAIRGAAASNSNTSEAPRAQVHLLFPRPSRSRPALRAAPREVAKWLARRSNSGIATPDRSTTGLSSATMMLTCLGIECQPDFLRMARDSSRPAIEIESQSHGWLQTFSNDREKRAPMPARSWNPPIASLDAVSV